MTFNYLADVLPRARLLGASVSLIEPNKRKFADAVFYRWLPSYKASGKHPRSRMGFHNLPKTTQLNEFALSGF